MHKGHIYEFLVLGLYIPKAILLLWMFIYFNKIMLFHFNENLHELCLHLNIMYVCLLFYIYEEFVTTTRAGHHFEVLLVTIYYGHHKILL